MNVNGQERLVTWGLNLEMLAEEIPEAGVDNVGEFFGLCVVTDFVMCLVLEWFVLTPGFGVIVSELLESQLAVDTDFKELQVVMYVEFKSEVDKVTS